MKMKSRRLPRAFFRERSSSTVTTQVVISIAMIRIVIAVFFVTFSVTLNYVFFILLICYDPAFFLICYRCCGLHIPLSFIKIALLKYHTYFATSFLFSPDPAKCFGPDAKVRGQVF